MSGTAKKVRRIAFAARLLAMDLLRRRLTLLLMFLVPALLDTVPYVTTAKRDIEVTLGALVEEGATIAGPEAPIALFDTSLLDNGLRVIDQRALSLVFLAGAGVSFVMCFLAFHLVNKRREVDARLVLAGYRTHEVLAAKVLVLVALVALLSIYETAVIRPFLVPAHTPRVVAAFFLGGLTYACIGLLIGAVVGRELEGVFSIVLLTNVDIGWLQNPVYYAASDRREVIEALPGYYPAQLAVIGAFTGDVPRISPARCLLYAGATVAAATFALGLRMRPAPMRVTERSRLRRHYARVLFLVYPGVLVVVTAVSRYTATLHAAELRAAWSQWIPFVPEAVWLREAALVFPLAVLPFVEDWHRVNIAVVATLFAIVGGCVVHVLAPISFPGANDATGLAARVLQVDRTEDGATLPNLRIAVTWITASALLGGSRSIGIGALAVGVSITVATILVAPQESLGVLAGLGWGLGAFGAAGLFYKRWARAGAPADEALARTGGTERG